MANTGAPAVPRPLPKPTRLSAPYWKAAKEHRLALPKCKNCGNLHFYPRSLCPNCWHNEFEWTEVSGKGKIYSYTVLAQPGHPAFAADVPYVYAIIELEEGPRMVSNIVGCKPEEISIGKPVEVIFDDVTPDVTLPKFRLVAH